jgi:hypothetical protein
MDMKNTKICPICGGMFKIEEYLEDIWGTFEIVERHNSCDRCGYREEQCYSDVFCGFEPPIKKGYRGYKDKYVKKNIRKRKRMKRKYNIKYGDKNWLFYYI